MNKVFVNVNDFLIYNGNKGKGEENAIMKKSCLNYNLEYVLCIVQFCIVRLNE